MQDLVTIFSRHIADSNHAVCDDGITATIALHPKQPLIPFVIPSTASRRSSDLLLLVIFHHSSLLFFLMCMSGLLWDSPQWPWPLVASVGGVPAVLLGNDVLASAPATLLTQTTTTKTTTTTMVVTTMTVPPHPCFLKSSRPRS
jgi:hypothetical protein